MARQCKVCNNKTRNPSGYCHHHDGSTKWVSPAARSGINPVPPRPSEQQARKEMREWQKQGSFAGVRGLKMKPTRNHRIAMGENMLGTVWAISPEGKYEYFDYNWDAAKEWAGIDEDSDPRIWKSDGAYSVARGATSVRRGQVLLYIKRK